jgi:hypothetical protein
MNRIRKKIEKFIYESPWPILVSAASLFLTLGAVLFFHLDLDVLILSLIFWGVSSKDIEYKGNKYQTRYSMLGMIGKSKTNLLYFSASVVSGSIYRKYSYQSWGYGNAGWDPDNYGPAAQKVFIDLHQAMLSNDKVTMYNTMYAIINNEKGVFTQGYGKVFRNIDSMLVQYNKINFKDQITEKGFLDYYGYNYDNAELFFLDHTNRGTITTNIQEILAPKVMMQKNSLMLVERSIDVQGKVNLSGQKNPEYTIGMFVSQETGNLNVVAYDSDLKTTDDLSLYKKLFDLAAENKLNIVHLGQKKFLGFNIFVVASKDSEIKSVILNTDQINLISTLIKEKALSEPQIFSNFNPESTEFKKFISTGDTKYLNNLNVPSPRFLIPQDFKDLMHKREVFENSNVYKELIKFSDADFSE